MSAFTVRSILRVRFLPIVLLITLLMFLVPVRPLNATSHLGVGQSLSSELEVTSIFASVVLCHHQNNYDWEAIIRFIIHLLRHEHYLGIISEPGIGIKEATFLLTSLSNGQTTEYPNVQVSKGSIDGEYIAQILIKQDKPDRAAVSIEKGSLTLTFQSGTMAGHTVNGPLSDMTAELTDDTSDSSVVDLEACVTQDATQPTQTAAQLETNVLAVISISGLFVLLALVAIVVRRKR